LGWNDKKKRRSGRGKKRLLGWNFNPALAAAALRAMSGFAATGFNSKATWFGSLLNPATLPSIFASP
jgi:hypothetical protein